MSGPKEVPLEGSFQARWSQHIASVWPADKLEELKNGTPIFTKEHILESSHPLDIILRSLFVRENITAEYFARAFMIHGLKYRQLDVAKSAQNKSNALDAIRKGGITIKRFDGIIRDVLGYETDDMVVTFKKDNKKITVSVADAVKDASAGK